MTPIPVNLWRDYDPQVLAAREMHLDMTAVRSCADEVAADFFARGARRVALLEPIDLAEPGDGVAAVGSLVLVRELTSRGIVVDWSLRPPTDFPRWRLLSHLPTPTLLGGPDATIVELWRDSHCYFGCVDRQGPGFLQVRDRRSGPLRRITIDAAEYRAVIAGLREGMPLADVPRPILARLVAADLADVVGTTAWWLPYRVRRWPRSTSLL